MQGYVKGWEEFESRFGINKKINNNNNGVTSKAAAGSARNSISVENGALVGIDDEAGKENVAGSGNTDITDQRLRRRTNKKSNPSKSNAVSIQFEDIPWIPEPPAHCHGVHPQHLLLAVIGLGTLDANSARLAVEWAALSDKQRREKMQQQQRGSSGSSRILLRPCSTAHPVKDQKAACRRAMLRWHPDKFTQAYGPRLGPDSDGANGANGANRAAVMQAVKATTQRLVALKTDLGM